MKATAGPNCATGFKLQIEMEWFEKHIHSRAYTWEPVPGDEKKDPARPLTTAQPIQ